MHANRSENKSRYYLNQEERREGGRKEAREGILLPEEKLCSNQL